MAPKSYFRSLLFSFAVGTSLVQAQQCFWPNGDMVLSGKPGACSQDKGACCPAGWECLENGLCHYAGGAYGKPDLDFFIRYSCKDGYGPPCTDICKDGAYLADSLRVAAAYTRQSTAAMLRTRK